MEYFMLSDDLDTPPDRWFLGEVNFDDEWDFWNYITIGRVEVPRKELVVNVKKEGFPLDFTFADFELLILNQKVTNLLLKNEVQSIPIKINGYSSEKLHFLTTIINGIDCVDEEKSVFDKWELGNDIRPDKAGHYKTFYKLFVKPEKCEGCHIFRIKNYHSIIIVSGKMKADFEKNNITGVKFRKV